MKKKLLSAILATTMALSLQAGCVVQAAEEAAVEGEYPDLNGETFTIWFSMLQPNAKVTNDMGEYQVIKDLEEKLNCKFEFIHPPVGQEQDNFSIMMSDTVLPDMIFCSGIDLYYPGGVEMAYEDGVLFDYTDLINEENTPNFYKLINENENMKKNVTDDEGRIIRLGAKVCGSPEADFYFWGPLVRKDYLEATGLDKPVTIADWTEMLAAMKANGVEYPLALSKKDGLKRAYFSSAFGVNGDDFFLREDGSVAYSPYEDNYKDFLTQLNEWYEAGYINPDFTTQLPPDVIAMAAADQVGVVPIHLEHYFTNYHVTTASVDPSKDLLPLELPVMNEGDTLPAFRSSFQKLDDYKYITADAKNPEACMAILDVLYDEEVNKAMTYGVEGVGYTEENGVITPLQIPADASEEVMLQIAPEQLHTQENVDAEETLQKFDIGNTNEALKLWAEQGTERTLPNAIQYTQEESDFLATYKTDILTYVEEMSQKFVLGKEPLENFDAYKETLKELHVEEWIAIQQAAVDRYNAR